jgi:hypothetical protein
VLGHPQIEMRDISLQSYGLTNTFGNSTRPSDLIRLYELETHSHDTMFVIISDVHLDAPLVRFHAAFLQYIIIALSIRVLQGFSYWFFI